MVEVVTARTLRRVITVTARMPLSNSFDSRKAHIDNEVQHILFERSGDFAGFGVFVSANFGNIRRGSLDECVCRVDACIIDGMVTKKTENGWKKAGA
jgi:hypothetical protein